MLSVLVSMQSGSILGADKMSKASITVLVFIVLILLVIAFYVIKKLLSGKSCCGTSHEKTKKKKLKRLAGQVLFEVEDMHCGHCKSTVENAVNAIDGLSATADLEKRLLCVNYEGQIDKTAVINAVESLGYRTREIER